MVYLLSVPEQTKGPPLSPKHASLPPSFNPAQSIPEVILYNGKKIVFLRHSSVDIRGNWTSCKVSAVEPEITNLYVYIYIFIFAIRLGIDMYRYEIQGLRTKYSADLEQLSPTGDGASGPALRLVLREAYRSYVITERNRSFEPEKGNVVDETIIDVIRMKDDVIET